MTDLFQHARRIDEIRRLNDEFRTTFQGGEVYITEGVKSLFGVMDILEQVKAYNRFTAKNDPYQEHDSGTFGFRAYNFFWKIDYYDEAMEHGSEDPADPDKTTRVLTIGLTEEL
jgi:hypothetical protein